MALGAILSSSPGGGCHEADAGEEECGQSPPGAWARKGELGRGWEVGDPRDSRREKLGSHVRWPPDPLMSSSIITICPLAPRGLRGDDLSPLSFLFSQGCSLPPSCLLRRLGSDHLDVWALPREQGGSGGRLLPGPPFPQACCAAFVPIPSHPVLRASTSASSPLLPLPHRLPK